jgi:anti-sigma-K factor RskA
MASDAPEIPEQARGGGVWRGLALIFALAAIVLGALYLDKTPQVATANYVAVVTDAETGPVWLLRAFVEPAELLSNIINPRPEPPNSSYELWMLPDNGTAPVSLGLIAGTRQTTVQLSAAALAVLAGASTLAVSVEPAGGSPTGEPTEPVIYTAPLVRF